MTGHEKSIITQIKLLLKKKYCQDSSGHDYFHLERVWKMAKKLAGGEKLDRFVLEAAALLHDVDDYKFKKPGEDELKNTRDILSKFNLDEMIKNRIYDIVSHVSFKGGEGYDKQFSKEGKIVQDADRLDVLGAIGIARVFSYGGWAGHVMYDPEVKPRKNLTFEEYKKPSPSYNHFFEKILLLKDRMNTPKAIKIAVRRHKLIEKYLREFKKETGLNF